MSAYWLVQLLIVARCLCMSVAAAVTDDGPMSAARYVVALVEVVSARRSSERSDGDGLPSVVESRGGPCNDDDNHSCPVSGRPPVPRSVYDNHSSPGVPPYLGPYTITTAVRASPRTSVRIR